MLYIMFDFFYVFLQKKYILFVTNQQKGAPILDIFNGKMKLGDQLI